MKGKMKAWNFIKPLGMHLEERDIPQIGPDEVLVKVKAVGICGSDVSYYYGHSPLDTPPANWSLATIYNLQSTIYKVQN